MSIPNGIRNKIIKKEQFHDKVISLQKHITKGLRDDVVSISNTFIPTYISICKPIQDTMQLRSLITVHQPQTGRNCK